MADTQYRDGFGARSDKFVAKAQKTMDRGTRRVHALSDLSLQEMQALAEKIEKAAAIVAEATGQDASKAAKTTVDLKSLADLEADTAKNALDRTRGAADKNAGLVSGMQGFGDAEFKHLNDVAHGLSGLMAADGQKINAGEHNADVSANTLKNDVDGMDSKAEAGLAAAGQSVEQSQQKLGTGLHAVEGDAA